MTKSSLPIIDLAVEDSEGTLAARLYDVFTTTGFAYLVNAPLSFTSDDVFALARDFFLLPEEEKMRLAKRSFRSENTNTYRGYFPVQPEQSSTNLKEGFEIGPPTTTTTPPAIKEDNREKKPQIILSEPNIWPTTPQFKPTQSNLETLHTELQSLSAKLLSALALSLNKDANYFNSYLTNSLSTLRLLHYPTTGTSTKTQNGKDVASKEEEQEEEELSCTPHTDSGLLTLLHQDSTGGLEVLDSTSTSWLPVPPIPGSIVVNIGDLMARVSGGRFIATMHRVRRPMPPPSSFSSSPSVEASGNPDASQDGHGDMGMQGANLGRLSVPFFFEPGEACLIQSVDGDDNGVIYGEHVRGKMQTWVEFM